MWIRLWKAAVVVFCRCWRQRRRSPNRAQAVAAAAASLLCRKPISSSAVFNSTRGKPPSPDSVLRSELWIFHYSLHGSTVTGCLYLSALPCTVHATFVYLTADSFSYWTATLYIRLIWCFGDLTIGELISTNTLVEYLFFKRLFTFTP